MRLRPERFIVDKTNPFANDILDRRAQVEQLANMIREAEGPHLFVIDASWGSGKTVFLNMLARVLRNSTLEVVELNAWQTAVGNDPLAALCSAMKAETESDDETRRQRQIQELSTEVQPAQSGVLSTITTLLMSALKDIEWEFSVGPPLAKVTAHRRAADDQPKESRVEGDDQLNARQIEEKRKIEDRFSTYEASRTAIDDFRESLKCQIGSSSLDEMPLVFCVDELDRCRPEYAIRFLEMVQHLLDVDRVVFVVAVNLAELAHAIRIIYGNDFDGTTYLRRFVDYFIYLDPGDRRSFVDHLLESSGVDESSASNRYMRTLLQTLVVESPYVSLRDLRQTIPYLCRVVDASTMSSSGFRMPLNILVATMMTFRIVAPHAYRSFVRRELSDLDALESMNRIANRSNDWWKDSRSVEQQSACVTLEAIMIGWARRVNGSSDAVSPLLEKRNFEAQGSRFDSDYPSRVVAEANSIVYTFVSDFAIAQSFVEATYDGGTLG